MKNSTLEREGEVLGEMENEDLASTLQTHLDTMFDDELERAIIDTKRLINASTARLHIMVAELDRREIPHIIHWADDGPTSLENLVLLCRKHHTLVHGRTTYPRTLLGVPECYTTQGATIEGPEP